jgi:hypothetical protein
MEYGRHLAIRGTRQEVHERVPIHSKTTTHHTMLTAREIAVPREVVHIIVHRTAGALTSTPKSHTARRVRSRPKPSDFSGEKNPQHAFLRSGSKRTRNHRPN